MSRQHMFKFLSCSGLVLFLTLPAVVAAGAPPIWEYEIMPSAYDAIVSGGGNVLLRAKAVENPATGEPAIFWTEHVSVPNDVHIYFYFAQRTASGWPGSPEVVAIMTKFLGGNWPQGYDVTIDSSGTPCAAYSVAVDCDPIEDGWDKYVYYKKRTAQGWPMSPQVVGDAQLDPEDRIIHMPWDGDHTFLSQPFPGDVRIELGLQDEPVILYNTNMDVTDPEDDYEHLYLAGRLDCWLWSGQEWEPAYHESVGSLGASAQISNFDLAMSKDPNVNFLRNIVRGISTSGSPLHFYHDSSDAPTDPWRTTGSVSDGLDAAFRSLALNAAAADTPAVIFQASVSGNSVLYYTEYDGTTWSTPESFATVGLDHHVGTLNYLEGAPQLVIGQDQSSGDDGEILVWRYIPSGDYWSYLTVADEQEYGDCAMAVNRFTGTRNVFLEGNGTGLDGKTLMAYKSVWFFDDFNDGDYNGWSVWSGSWSAAAEYLRMTPGAPGTIAKLNTDNDLEFRFSFVCNDTSDNNRYLTVSPRYASNGDRIYLTVKPAGVLLAQRVNSVWTSLGGVTAPHTQGSEYYIRVVCDGSDVDVYRNAAGAAEELIISTSNCTVASTNYVSFTPYTDADFNIDNVSIKSDDYYNP